jgi:hypothetical protein
MFVDDTWVLWMELKKIYTALAFVLLLGIVVMASPTPLPPANQSMHNVQQNEQRGVTPGGAGLPGGTNPYFPTNFPLPSPTARR